MILDVAAQRPKFSAAEAIELVRAAYGVTAGQARALPSDRDQNFYLAEAGEKAFVLKIAGSAEEEAILDFQNQALLHLAQTPDLAGLVPRLIPALDGALIAYAAGESGQVHCVRLLTHLPGTPLAKVEAHTEALLAESGRLLGALDQALDDFNHTAMDRRLHWDLAHAQETLAKYAPFITDAQKRALVDRFLAQFAAEVAPALPDLRWGVIHGDGNDHNILVSTADGSQRVSGLIDFGDMVHSCLVFEPAIAAAYLMLDKDDPMAAGSAVVRGYHAVNPLTEEEIALLPAAMGIRLCLSVALSASQQAQEPDNAYLSVSERPAWDLLAKLAALPPGHLHDRLRAACDL